MPKPSTWPQCGPTACWTPFSTGIPFCEIIFSSCSGCQRLGSFIVVPGLLTTSGSLTGCVVRRRVAVGLVRAVVQAVGEDRGGDPVADRGGRVAVGRVDRHRVAQRVHDVRELGERVRAADRLDEPGGEHAVRGVADRLVAGRGDVAGVLLGRVDVAVGRRVVRRPGVPHRDRRVEQVPGVDRRVRERAPDRVEQRLVPASGDGPVGVLGGCRAGAIRRQDAGHPEPERRHDDHRHEADGEQRPPSRAGGVRRCRNPGRPLPVGAGGGCVPARARPSPDPRPPGWRRRPGASRRSPLPLRLVLGAPQPATHGHRIIPHCRQTRAR